MDLELYPIILAVVLAHFLALLSPGPDFLIVVKSGIKNTKNIAIGVAFGIALANAIYIIICIVGVGAIIAKSVIIMILLKVLGGIFLIYLAMMSLKSRKRDYEQLILNATSVKAQGSTFKKEFLIGFLSGILNPKNIIFYLSLFSLVLTNEVSLVVKVALGVWMTFLVFSWDTFIILVLSRNSIRELFSKLAFYIDKIAGVVLGLFGVKLIQSAIVRN